MGHILLAAPPIERFHLHEQVSRRLLRRGHRVTLLCTDPVTHRCYDVHGMPARLLAPARRPDAADLPTQELAARDLRLTGNGRPEFQRLLRRYRARLEHAAPTLVRQFETELPDLVVTFQGRSGLHRLIDAVAQRYGCATTHLGDGLLPGTMQHDPVGIDGDASIAARPTAYYRAGTTDRGLCEASLAAAIGDFDTPPIARRFVHPPDFLDGLACLATARSPAAARWALSRLRAWRSESERPVPKPEPNLFGLPSDPFVAVLLQEPHDPRVLLDTQHGGPHALELCRAVRRAIRSIDPSLGVVAITSPDLDAAVVEAIRADGVRVRSMQAAATAIATAAAVVTVNHPLAMVGLLADTPVLHLGSALYDLPGITRRTSLEQLRADLETAIHASPHPSLRLRFASRVLTEDHIWCDAKAPDPNGLRGIVHHLEAQLERSSSQPETAPYRPGPGWPLVRGA
jgi:hypothetical protein